MGRLGAAIGAGVLTAAGAGFLFWMVNRTFQVNNVGWLVRQGGPVGDWRLWATVGFAIGFVGYLIRAARRAAHMRAVREVASAEGWEYAESFALPAGAEAMPAFAGWSNGRHAMSGLVDGVPVHVFDCTTVIKGDENDTVTVRTVALVPIGGLPDFDLRPRSVGRRLLSLAGFDGLSFDPEAAGPADVDTVRQFNEQFQLWVGDPLALLRVIAAGESPDRAEHEVAIRRLFTPAVMAAVSDFPNYAAEAAAGYLAVWHRSGIQPARTRPALRDAAVTLRQVFLRAERTGSEPVVPARPNSGTDRQVGRMRNAAIGGVAGLFGGFTVSAVLMPLMLVGAMNDNGPGVGFFVHPLVFLGCVLGGALFGALIGSRVPVRARPSEDPEQRNRRVRATMRGGVVGLFVGFFGGFFLFAVTQIAFGWRVDNFGVEGALFFGSTFGGGGFGATLGALIGRRLRQ
jgi:hypothetical protein